MLVKDASAFESLARDFPEHAVVVANWNSCVLVHVFSSVLTRQTRKERKNKRTSFYPRFEEEEEEEEEEVMMIHTRKTMTNTDLVIEEKRFARLRTRYNIVCLSRDI